LYGPGRANEHHDPHIVAGWRHPADLEPHLNTDGDWDLHELTELLEQPVKASFKGAAGHHKPVWHCVLRTAPEDRRLSDSEWAEAGAMVMEETGLAPPGDIEGVRWILLHHAHDVDDHVHLVATLARVDGRRPALHHDHYRVAETCRRLEHRFDLRRLGAGDRTAARSLTRAEIEQVRRRKRTVASRVALRRAVMTAAAASSNEAEFFTHLERVGIKVKLRASGTDPGEKVGYCVALPGHTTAAGDVVWYAGGSLAADLTWPKLRRRWLTPAISTALLAPASPAEPGGALDIRRDQVPGLLAAASADVRRAVNHAPEDADDVAWATSDVLHVTAAAAGETELRLAAEVYDRAARAPYGRLPKPTAHGQGLRAAARLMAADDAETKDTRTSVTLLAGLAGLVETIAELRHGQHRSVQALAARSSAEHLRGAIAEADTPSAPATERGHATQRGDSAWSLVKADFPTAPRTTSSGETPDSPGAQRPDAAPRRERRPPDPSGPSR
jgi:hypothetical protein